MSEHPRQPHPEDGEPKVYHPQAAETPAYEEYVDPAAAHGWQNAYDETRELPTVADGEHPAPATAARVPDVAPGFGAAGRPRGGRGARRKPSAWRSRRTAVATGALGAVSAAALIAGFTFSGSSSGGSDDQRDRTGVPSAGDTGPTPTPGTSGPDASDGTGGGKPSGSASPSPSTTGGAGDDTDDKPSATAPASTAPASTAPASTAPASTAPATTAPATTAPAGGGPGNSGHRPGNGQGTTKGPK
ncbi:hypothetical protein [Streptomyces broussonetiae]|uniref:CAP domain-containing protein n=1 Tax=Streptomyces broussonetiae TaxID=2686304 RepID=A0ABV5E6J6_9ACTN